ncbi:hypothetical protein ACQP1V_27395 [Microtetraspora malaysiensis]|uniref:hypothetical protein n=1 Tax=Microtetraspora malaysiensis TaxID=161358 RepID=UPI003D923604
MSLEDAVGVIAGDLPARGGQVRIPPALGKIIAAVGACDQLIVKDLMLAALRRPERARQVGQPREANTLIYGAELGGFWQP